MPLPSISAPTYTLQIPSTGEKIKYRPFLVKEEKILIIARESEDPEQIAEAIKQVLQNCIITKNINVENLATFDIEYLFLNVRGKSVGETVEVLITCPDDMKTKVPVSIDLDSIEVAFNENHSRDVKLNDEYSIRMKYPSLKEFIIKNYEVENSSSIALTFDTIASCIEQIYTEEESWNTSDFTPDEIKDFIDNLSPIQFSKIEDFFETMPTLSHELEIMNPNTKVKNKITLEGLNSFLA